MGLGAGGGAEARRRGSRPGERTGSGGMRFDPGARMALERRANAFGIVYISSVTRSPSDEGLAAELGAVGLRATRQRIGVLRVLRRRRSHPTAADIHGAVAHRIPGLSLKTVYHVLETLVAHGVAACVSEGGTPLRYEARTEPHDHALCRVCGKLYDLSQRVYSGPERLAGLPAGFEAERVAVRVQGRCRHCRGGP